MFNEFISTYGATILYTVITAIAGYIGLALKSLYEKTIDTRTKHDVVATVVLAVEQIYNDLKGDEKLYKALEAANEMLTDKGIKVTDIELRLLIEAALAEFNNAFDNHILNE